MKYEDIPTEELIDTIRSRLSSEELFVLFDRVEQLEKHQN